MSIFCRSTAPVVLAHRTASARLSLSLRSLTSCASRRLHHLPPSSISTRQAQRMVSKTTGPRRQFLQPQTVRMASSTSGSVPASSSDFLLDIPLDTNEWFQGDYREQWIDSLSLKDYSSYWVELLERSALTEDEVNNIVSKAIIGDEKARLEGVKRLLEEVEQTKGYSKSMVGVLKGEAVNAASDLYASRVLSKLIEVLPSKYRSMIVSEILGGDIVALVSTTGGFKVLSTILQVGAEAEKQTIVKALVGNVVDFATDVYGSSFLRQSLEVADSTLRQKLIEELKGNVLHCARDFYGASVVAKAIEHADADTKKALQGEISGFDLLSPADLQVAAAREAEAIRNNAAAAAQRKIDHEKALVELVANRNKAYTALRVEFPLLKREGQSKRGVDPLTALYYP